VQNLCLAKIHSAATTQTLCNNLQTLGLFAATDCGDIDKLHNKFDKNYSQLIARGATIDDPIGILFDANLVVPCTISSHSFAASMRTTLMANLTPSPTRH
jgi:hypothetical protein